MKTLSQLLETGRPILTGDDVARLDEESRDAFLSRKILAPARPATHVVCDACHDGHVEEVSRIKTPNGAPIFRIRCPEAGWVVVPDNRLRQWTIDTRRLVSLLSESVASSEQSEEAILGVAWRLGTVAVGDHLFGLAFILNSELASDSFWNEMARKFPPSQTILIHVGDTHSIPVEFVARVPLESAFGLADDRVVLRRDRIRSVISTSASAQGNMFQRRGDYWHISFDGATTTLKDSVGFVYIARLLMEQRREIPAITLLSIRTGIDPRVASGSSGETLDDETRRQYGQRYPDLLEELDLAKKNCDDGLVAKLEREKEMIEKQIAAAYGLGGRSRRSTDVNRVRTNVTMAVRRGIEQISRKHQSLGRHLDSSISSGFMFCYSPEQDVDWVF